MCIRIRAHAALVNLVCSLVALAAFSSLASAAGSGSHSVVQSFSDAETSATPHWCNSTGALVDNIERLGGESVMRVDLSDGRRLERYWNASEEVTIEHGTDGNSCLVELRARASR